MNLTKYENQLPYPSMPSRKCECGHMNHTDAKWCNDCGVELTFTSRYNQYQKLRSEYRVELNRLEDLFKVDLLDYLDIRHNPKSNLLFDKAWKMGHSNGHSEVLIYAEDLVDLID